MLFNNEDISNTDAEKSILGIILINPEIAQVVKDQLSAEDFFDNQHKIIYQAITILLRENKTADIVTVSERLKFDNELDNAGGRSYINKLAEEVITTANYKNYVKIILKYSKKRQLLYMADTVRDMFFNGSDVDTVAKYTLDISNRVLLNDTSSRSSAIINSLDTVMNEVNAVLTSETRTFGLSTGFRALDQVLSGLCKSKLYILGARPSVGKSALAQQIGEYVAQSKNVLFHSLEMEHSQYTKRSIFRRANLNTEMLTRGLIDNETAMDRIAQVAGNISNLRLNIDDTPDCTLKTIEKNIVSMKNNLGSCDLVIVDYLQLMKSDNKKIYDRFDIVSRNSRGLKQLANKYNIPILVLCQLSRQVDNRENKRPILSDLRDSGDIEQDADVVMFLYREELYNPLPINKGKAELIIAKNREGNKRVIPMLFNGSKTEFVEAENRSF